MADDDTKNKRRARGGGGLHLDSRGLWRGTVWVVDTNGKRKQKVVSSKNKAIASGKLNQLRSDVLAGKVTAEPKASWTITQWADHWLTDIATPNVRPKTLKSYEGTVRLYIKPNLGGIRLDKLQPTHVRTMRTALQKAGSTRNVPGQRARTDDASQLA